MMHSLLFAVAFTVAACDAPASAPPVAPEQTPGPSIVEYSEDVAHTDDALQELKSLKNTIDQSLRTFRNLEVPLDGEAQVLAQEIIEDCDSLEKQASDLAEQPYMREHAGAGVELEDLIRFARDTRIEVKNLE